MFSYEDFRVEEKSTKQDELKEDKEEGGSQEKGRIIHALFSFIMITLLVMLSWLKSLPYLHENMLKLKALNDDYSMAKPFLISYSIDYTPKLDSRTNQHQERGYDMIPRSNARKQSKGDSSSRESYRGYGDLKGLQLKK